MCFRTVPTPPRGGFGLSAYYREVFADLPTTEGCFGTVTYSRVVFGRCAYYRGGRFTGCAYSRSGQTAYYRRWWFRQLCLLPSGVDRVLYYRGGGVESVALVPRGQTCHSRGLTGRRRVSSSTTGQYGASASSKRRIIDWATTRDPAQQPGSTVPAPQAKGESLTGRRRVSSSTTGQYGASASSKRRIIDWATTRDPAQQPGSTVPAPQAKGESLTGRRRQWRRQRRW